MKQLAARLHGEADAAAQAAAAAGSGAEAARWGDKMGEAGNAYGAAVRDYRTLLSRSLEDTHPELRTLRVAYEQADDTAAVARTEAAELTYAASDAFHAWDDTLSQIAGDAYHPDRDDQ